MTSLLSVSTTTPPRVAPVVTFGETMALLTSERPGPLAHASEMTLGMGGAESNVAIGLARLGCAVTWIGRVGDDALGHLVAREIQAEGVHTVAVVDDEAPTGLMLKERRTSSIQKVHYYRSGSAGSRLRPGDIPLDSVRAASVLHVTGITAAVSESAREAIRRAVSVAVEAGVPVSFDVNFRSALWSTADAASFAREIIPSADIVFASPEEAAIAVGPHSSEEGLAHALVALGAKTAVVKLGERGSLAVSGGGLHRQDAYVVPVVDTVGAGDAFSAGYLAQFIIGEDVPTCLELGTVVGAFVCTCPGDWEGLPRREELSLLASSDPVSR